MPVNIDKRMVSRVGFGNDTNLKVPINQGFLFPSVVHDVQNKTISCTQDVHEKESAEAVTFPIGQGFYALVDVADEEMLKGRKWRPYLGHGTLYAKDPFGMPMHRLILGAKKGEVVDHIDGNGLNNTRRNIRICTSQENSFNMKPRPVGTVSYKGVYRRPGTLSRPYRAQIQKDGKKTNLGDYATPEEAARAYDAAAILVHGVYARVNFPEHVEYQVAT